MKPTRPAHVSSSSSSSSKNACHCLICGHCRSGRQTLPHLAACVAGGANRITQVDHGVHPSLYVDTTNLDTSCYVMPLTMLQSDAPPHTTCCVCCQLCYTATHLAPVWQVGPTGSGHPRR
jgi:hypothetical protein